MLGNSQEPTQDIGPKTSIFKRGIFIYGSIILVVAVFSLGVVVGKQKAEVNITPAAGSTEYGQVTGKDAGLPDYLSQESDFALFWQVWNIIQNSYIDRPVGETQLFYGALNGMLDSLNDPYSFFLEPQTATEFSDELSGKFEGVGMEIAIKNDVLTVVTPLAESPAERAGIRAKDIILSIDGRSSEGIDINDAVDRIRGAKGSTVNFEIYRPKTMEWLEISVVREVIKIVSVELKYYTGEDFEILGENEIALIKVTNFNSDTAGRFQNAVQDIILSNPDGLILDLRGNPGGFLDTAVEMVDWWVDAGEIVVIEQFAADDKEMYLGSTDGVLDKFPTVVLIDGGSASGSEIVAGALKDHGLARLIGEASFGKGSVQQLEELPGGSAVKITIARWLTPNGTTIDKEGIQPDIVIERTLEDYNNEVDLQLERALEFLIRGE